MIIPGSKSTVPDMRALKGTGMAAVLRELAEGRTRIVGVCGGFQMLGRVVDDPYGLESETTRVEGFDLLAVQTSLAPEKTLTRTFGTHSASGLAVHGYEIHHGHTEPLSGELRVALRDNAGEPLGYMRPDGRVLGTYLHGLFDADGFRRWFIDQLRMDKGLSPLESIQTVFGSGGRPGQSGLGGARSRGHGRGLSGARPVGLLRSGIAVPAHGRLIQRRGQVSAGRAASVYGVIQRAVNDRGRSAPRCAGTGKIKRLNRRLRRRFGVNDGLVEGRKYRPVTV